MFSISTLSHKIKKIILLFEIYSKYFIKHCLYREVYCNFLEECRNENNTHCNFVSGYEVIKSHVEEMLHTFDLVLLRSSSM